MADFGKAVEAFQGGADWRQRYRANKQIEQARDLALEGGNYDMEQRRSMRKLRDPDTAGVLGELDPNSVNDWGGQLQDPFATKLGSWFKTHMGKGRKKRSAIDLGGGSAGGNEFGSSTPTAGAPVEAGTVLGEAGSITNPQDDSLDPEAQTFGMDYADGGSVDLEALARQQERNARIEIAKQRLREVPGKARQALKGADEAVGRATGRAAEGAGKLSKAAKGLKRLGAAGALLATGIDTAQTPTEDYRERFGLETDDPSLAGDIGVRTLGAASDLGNAMSFGLAGNLYRDKQRKAAEAGAAPADEAPQSEPMLASQGGGGGSASAYAGGSGGGRAALPTQSKASPVDFSDVDIDPHEVPDMKTNDWVKYRAQVVDAARKSGNPAAVKEAGDMVTQMQQEGFMNYGRQGFSLQQAGNIRGAMAAYRAAFQYFPNGNDVEFGVHKGKDGRQQIVGVGVDEQTGKRVPGSEMVMDPERVSVLLENFKNPQAFRMWTKDWRDDQFKERQYNEVTKPLAQATVDYQADQGEAAVARANATAANAGVGANGANMRNAEKVFRTRMQAMGLEDEPQADFLASIMSQVKVANPTVPDNVIVQTIMTAHRDGSLQKRLQRMGVGGGGGGGGAPALAPRSALPAEETGAADDPAMVGLSPEEREWANTPAQ